MTIRWNKKAEQQWQLMAIYIANEFGRKAVEAFVANVNQWQIRLIDNPLLGSPEPLLKERRYDYRSLVIHKHCKLVYYIKPNQNTIRIAALWDTRREPGKLKSNV